MVKFKFRMEYFKMSFNKESGILSVSGRCCVAVFMLLWMCGFLSGSVNAESGIHLIPQKTEGSEIEKPLHEKFVVTCATKIGADLKWKKDDKEISDDISKLLHVEKREDELILLFENVTKREEGKYVCQGDLDGKTFKKHFILKVSIPLKFVDTPTTQSAREGQSYTIKCKARGFPEPVIEWKIDGKAPDTKKYKPVSEGLRIFNVTQEDERQYICYADQIQFQKVERKEITFKLEHQPRLLKDENAYRHFGMMNHTANITCEVEAYPKAEIEWKRKDKTIKPTKNFINIIQEENRSVLQVHVYNMSVFGAYTCKAKNKHGSINRTVTLKEGDKPINLTSVSAADSLGIIELVIEDPNNVEPPVDRYVVKYLPEGQELDWDAASYKVLRKDLKPYVLEGLEPDTTYHVRVAARNKVGDSHLSEELIVRTTSKEHLTGASMKVFDVYEVTVLIVSLLGILIGQ